MPSANAEYTGVVTVTCTNGTFNVGWDNSNQYFADKGNIAAHYCDIMQHTGYVSTTAPENLQYYNGVVPVVSPSPTPSTSPTIAPEPTATPVQSPTPTPEVSTSPQPETSASPTPTVSESSTATVPAETSTATQQPTAPAPTEPSPSPSPTSTPVVEPVNTPAVQPQPQPEPAPEPVPSLSPAQIAAIEAAAQAAAQLAEEQRIAEEKRIAEEQAAIAEEINSAIEEAIADNGGELPIMVTDESSATLPVIESTPVEPQPPVDEPKEEVTPQPQDPTTPLEPATEEPQETQPIVQPVESIPVVSSEPPSASSVDLTTLAPDTPVQLDNGVVVTAEVAIAVELLQNPTELLSTALTDPMAAIAALSKVGADLPPEVRKKAKKVVVAAVIAGNIATSAALGAASPAASYRRKP